MELNEAFAAQSLACLSEWHDIDHDLVNPHGGAIAIGHPLGCSGARLAGAVAHQLAAAGSGVGVAALCIGVGQGLAADHGALMGLEADHRGDPNWTRRTSSRTTARPCSAPPARRW